MLQCCTAVIETPRTLLGTLSQHPTEKKRGDVWNNVEGFGVSCLVSSACASIPSPTAAGALCVKLASGESWGPQSLGPQDVSFFFHPFWRVVKGRQTNLS